MTRGEYSATTISASSKRYLQQDDLFHVMCGGISLLVYDEWRQGGLVPPGLLNPYLSTFYNIKQHLWPRSDMLVYDMLHQVQTNTNTREYGFRLLKGKVTKTCILSSPLPPRPMASNIYFRLLRILLFVCSILGDIAISWNFFLHK